MPINKLFVQGVAALDDCVDQLVEVLAQLLEEPQNPPAAGTDNQDAIGANRAVLARSGGRLL